MENEIKPMVPEGLKTYPVKPVKIDPVKPVKIDENIPVIDSTVSFTNIILLWIRESLITSIINNMKGIAMNNDVKTTIAGAIAAVAQLLGVFGLVVAPEIISVVTALAVAVGFYFANKKDAIPAETAK